MIKKLNIRTAMEKNAKPYMAYVVLDRAIPQIDGFKPSHRRVLYTMYKMGLLGDVHRTKSSNIEGQVMKLHPHSGTYDTMVRMSRGNESLSYPLVDSKGNFGKVYSRDGKRADARYTEAKLEDIAFEIFRDLGKDVVDMVDNFDNKIKEPSILPTAFPNILCNSTSGIAVGMASTIIPMNMVELNNGIIYYLVTGYTDMLYEANFDFPTRGEILYDEKEHLKIFETGQGRVVIRSKYIIDEKENKINITEIPYSTTAEAIIDNIIEQIKKGKFKEITNIEDEIDLHGMGIGINYKKGTNVKTLMAKLFKNTPLQTSMSSNLNMILPSGRPKVLGVIEVVDEWIKFRRNCIIRGLKFDLNLTNEKIHILKGLNKILTDVDKAINIIKESISDNESRQNLMARFDIDTIQTNYVLDMKFKNFNKTYIKNKTDELAILVEFVKELEFKIKNIGEVDKIIIEQLTNINAKYGTPRRTEIVHEYEDIKAVQIIEDYDINILFTNQGYIKKIKRNATGVNRLKDDDFIKKTIETNNKSDLYILTNLGNAHRVQLHTLDTTELNSLGDFIPNLIKLDNDEMVLDVFCIDSYDEGYVTYAYRNKNDGKGKIAKIEVESFKSKVNNSMWKNCLDMNSELLSVNYHSSEVNILFITENYRILISNTGNFKPIKTKNSGGVNVMDMDLKNKIPTDNILYAFMGVDNNSVLKVCTTKHPEGVELSLNNKHDDDRDYFDYFLSDSGKGKGSFMENYKKSKHVVTSVLWAD